MADGKNDGEFEKYGDETPPAKLAADMANMPNSTLAKIAGLATVLKDKECGNAKETSGETDGTCRLYNAALNEVSWRTKDEPQR